MLKVYNTASPVHLETFHTDNDIQTGAPSLLLMHIHLKQFLIEKKTKKQIHLKL